MATQNSSNNKFTNNADGFDIAGGTTARKLTATGADITLTGTGVYTYTFPTVSDTLISRTSSDTLTNKTLTNPTVTTGSFTSPAIVTSITTADTSFTAWAGATTLLTIGGTGASASMHMPSTLDATSTTTGAIRTSGGLSAAKSVWVGTTLVVTNNSAIGWDTTATAAGTTTMDITYKQNKFFTGTTTQTIKLPTTGVLAGQKFTIENRGSSNACVLTVQSSGANEILILGQGCSAEFTALQATPTTAAHWNFKKFGNNFKTATSYTTDTGTSLNCDYFTDFYVTAQTGALKFNNPTGTPIDGQTLILQVASDTTVARAITWDTNYLATTIALPSTTEANTNTLTIGFKYSASKSKWLCLAVA